ncbi:MAG TPA: tetratricopeptide repeat protein [Terriglobales bacterium]|nr:tetratricopeptide repeat protein [Terriglobales bacterium]
MGPQPVGVQPPIRFGEDFELEVCPRRLRRGRHVLKLERIPLEILILLVEQRDKIVTREHIATRVWGEGVFLDTDNSIRGAIRKVRQVLKDDPEQPRFIQTVTGQGYRFIAPIRGAEGGPERDRERVRGEEREEEPPTHFRSRLGGETIPAVNGAAESQAQQRRVDATQNGELLPATAARNLGPRSRRAILGLLLGGVGLSVLLAAAYIAVRFRSGTANVPKIRSLAVLPLKNLSGEPGQDYLADGMTEALIGRLSSIHDMRVISRTSVMQFKETKLLVPEIARTLGVDAIVEGSVIREGSRIRVHAQLIRASTDEHFWSEAYDRELGDVLALQSDVAQSIASKVEVTVTGQEHSRLVAARQVSPEVYESYLRGQFALHKSNRADVEESIHYFEQALNADPKFAPAYVALAAAYDDLGAVFAGAPSRETHAKVIREAQKALELDAQLADAHVLLADTYRKQWMWAESEAEYKRALELAPNNSAAHAGYAGWLLCAGRAAEAIKWAQRARELDPLDSVRNLAWILFQDRRYDDAARELHAALAVTPEDPYVLWYLGFVLLAEDKPGDAIPVLEKAVSVSHGSPGARGVLVRAYANAGRRKDALGVLDKLRRQRQAEYVPAGALVQAYMGIGDKEKALAWLEQAYKEESNLMQWIKTENTFDPLRGDPRFTDLIHRVGLDQAR